MGDGRMAECCYATAALIAIIRLAPTSAHATGTLKPAHIICKVRASEQHFGSAPDNRRQGWLLRRLQAHLATLLHLIPQIGLHADIATIVPRADMCNLHSERCYWRQGHRHTKGAAASMLREASGHHCRGQGGATWVMKACTSSNERELNDMGTEARMALVRETRGTSTRRD